MKDNFEHIFIYRSSIMTADDKRSVKDILDRHPMVDKWSVDLDDCDRVLRVISSQMTSKKIMELIGLCGYTCEELEG